eukprot:9503058-Pyramimonas_sp.AAC.1
MPATEPAVWDVLNIVTGRLKISNYQRNGRRAEQIPNTARRMKKCFVPKGLRMHMQSMQLLMLHYTHNHEQRGYFNTPPRYKLD